MEVDTDKLETLLETAIGHGSLEELMEFLCASGDEEYLNFVINEMRNNIKEILSTSPDSQFKITNILNIILGLAEIALFGPEKSEYLTRCLLNIAVNECCSIFNLKHVLTMLKTFFSDDHILAWGSSDESLFVPIKQLGVKLTDIGDYECQSILLETLWQISEADRNFWAQMWFSQEKSALMFLNLNPEKFVLECRQFLNFHNRNGGNQRTFAFVATSVSLGSVQLRKPYGAEFWVDFNHDTQSISFFCSSLHQENEQTWETVFISSEIVEGYCIQNQKSKTTKELLITLNCSCSQLLSLEDTSIAGLESQLIQMTFWSFLDIQCHAEALFKRNIPYPVEENVNSKAFKQARRASEPKEIVCSQDYQEQIAASQNSKRRRASEPIELLCTSNFPELHSTVSSLKRNKHKKASESTELVCPPDPQEMISKQHIRKRRRVSESLQLIPTVDRQGDTACETYADEVNAPDHTEHLPCEGSPEKQKRSSNNLVNLLGDNQNLHSDSKYTQDSVARNGQSAKKRSQNSELLAVSSVFPRKSSQVSIEKNVLTTKKSSRNAELLEVSSMSQRNLSQITSNGNVQSIPKRSQNAQLLEVFCDSPKKMSPDCVERHLQSTPNRSLNHGHRNSPQISPILAAAENCIQEIDTLRHVLNNNLPTEDKELSDFEMEVEMTDHQSKINKLHDTNMTVKKHRITRSKKNQENNSRHENSTELFDDEEPQIVTIHSPERKSRKAAVNARKRNKVILEQKGSETSFEGTQKINQQNITDGLSQETVEYDVHEALLPSKGKVLTSYKRKTLDRKKTIESKKKKPVKQKPRRSKKPIITPSNKVQRNKASDSESRSRSAFSEFNLVIEKEKIPLPSAELSGLFRSLKRNSRHSSITEDNFQSRNQEVELDGCYENENSVQLCYGDNISCISENSALNWGFNKSTNAKQQKVRPSTSGRSTIEPEVLSKDKKSIKNSNVSHKSKNSKDVNTSKQRLANLLMSKPIIEKSRNVEHSTSNDYTIVEDPTKKQKTNAGQGSEGFIRNSVADTVSNDPQNVQIALETVVKVSPFKRNKAVTSKRWISPNKIVEVSEEQSILEDMNTLTEKSLNERNDDTDKNKKRHLYSYLDSLSSVSPNPETAEKIGIAEDFLTLENTKSNPLIEKTSKEGLLQHSIPEEKIAKSSLKRPKQHAIKKHQTDYAKEFKPSDRSLQSSSAMFQKDHSNEKISCEYNLVTKTSVLHILSDEVNNLTFRLFCTLKKCMSDFRQKMVALRESIVKTADSMLANESKFSERDLQSLASDCRKSRLHIQKNLRKLYAMGNEYFESEKRLEKRLAKKNKKAVVKYTKSLQIAQSIAEKALEERFLLKSKAFLKSFLKKMELV
ncbi:hypothetical protein JTE90_024591 [Oedothorax gibbosus]|uniref:Synaptonemal complex protein 2 Spt16M-like domain-containing protein n=1 Tax=Oedothorax gibbosus TaxID=931172 RepID=A0AAV6VF55_9ARAC|nr:hypothetical protein JTE90_024591 [Oedothorax gibbosus]